MTETCQLPSNAPVKGRVLRQDYRAALHDRRLLQEGDVVELLDRSHVHEGARQGREAGLLRSRGPDASEPSR